MDSTSDETNCALPVAPEHKLTALLGRAGRAAVATATARFEPGSDPAAVALEPPRKRPKLVTSPRSHAFRRRHFPVATLAEWSDWQWQLRNRLQTAQALERVLVLSDEERAALGTRDCGLPFAVTPYAASLLDPTDPLQPLRRSHVPVVAETAAGAGEEVDPLHEGADSPVPGLVHRYPDRVLFLATGFCATHCRYCTRSRLVGGKAEPRASFARWAKAIAYIEAHPEVRDVLVSGGDPLTLPNDRLEWLLASIRRIRHVEIVRIGTKVPAVLPMRVTSELTRMLRKYHPLMMSLHFTHPDELTPEAAEACSRLADTGIPLGSQTVLLAGINDDVATMRSLVHGLLKVRVRPYYVYQCDPIRGSAHLRTPVERGVEILEGLRGFTTGYGVPTFVVDAPGGGGKIPVARDPVAGRDGDALLLRNYEGRLFRYPDPNGRLGQGPGGAPCSWE